jgi:photosystem II stability/assembly factor-like uncharacterized protein
MGNWRFLGLMLAALAASGATVDPKLLDSLEWRSIGPATMGGRISDIDAVPGDPAIVYAAAGSGGLFQSLDGGMTWKPIFERQTTISIGAIALQPGNPKVIWVGTGESNVRNSVSFGDGMYKSEDGGRTWSHVGLEATETISRIVLHPKNPNIAWVAAVGHPFGPNPERGVFMTEDGGRTWRKTLYIDDQHGAADLDIDPTNPDVLYAAMWHFDRKPWTYESGSEKGGVFQSTDGGRTWKKLTNGLPKLAGRIGVKVAPTNPNVVYAIAESREGTLFRSSDRGATFRKISDDRDLVGRGYYFADMRVAPDNENHIFVLCDSLLESSDAGKTFRRASPRVHGDLHALWIDPKDPRRIWQGHDGGLAVTYDAGAHWEQINNIPLGQFYQVTADNRRPFYNVTGGMQDNGSWTGPSRTREPGGIFNDDWRMVNAFVGMHALVDPDDPDILLTEQPGGALLRTDLRTREQQQVGPQVRSHSGAPASELKYRFNWDAPLVRSPFGKNTIYLAGNVIFQSSDSGKSWENISHDLTNHDESRLGNVGGPVWIDNGASEVYSTISALAESPVKRGVIWAGTDDGNLQVTMNGGEAWVNVSGNLPGAPPRSPFSSVEPSRADELAAYATLDRHMFDDFHPYIYKTSDGGKTWKNVSGNLPAKAFVWTVKEDPKNPNLLYAGTEIGVYASITAGNEWFPLHLKNLPWAIAVRDIVIHPDSNDLIIATHGRSVWVLDDATPLRELAGALGEDAHLFDIRPVFRFAVRATRFGYGDKTFTAPNPPYGALISYYLRNDASEARLQILESAGATVRDIPCAKQAGVNRVAWDLRYGGSGGRRGEGGGRGGGGGQGPQALPGSYLARLTVDGKTYERKFEVTLDPNVKVEMVDLKAQFETEQEVRKMEAAANAALAKLDARRAGSPAEVERIEDKLRRPRQIWRTETGPRLVENLQSLFNLLDAGDAAPTSAMLRYFGELRSEFNDAMTQADAFLKTAEQRAP